MTGAEPTATPPDRLRWIIGGDQHTEAWTCAAEWMHVNGHLDWSKPPTTREAPCHDCWRAAAFAVKGVILAGYTPPPPPVEYCGYCRRSHLDCRC